MSPPFFIDESLGIVSLSGWSAVIRGRTHLSFIYMTSWSALEEAFRLISPNGDILDMVIQNRELSLLL